MRRLGKHFKEQVATNLDTASQEGTLLFVTMQDKICYLAQNRVVCYASGRALMTRRNDPTRYEMKTSRTAGNPGSEAGCGGQAILSGTQTPAVRRRAETFFFSVASCFEAWVARRRSPHTQRAYREDIMSFVKFMGLAWPAEATELLRISIRSE